MSNPLIACVILLTAALPSAPGGEPGGGSAPASQTEARWRRSPVGLPDFFPIGVWLQDPKNAERYKAAGINTYVGLWKGPTEEQLAALRKAGMYAVCEQNEMGLKRLDDPTIIGWMQPDEPDNAQSLEKYWQNDLEAIYRAWPDAPKRTLQEWGQYGPPMPPARIVEAYQKMRTADPARPVFMNLGRGVVWEQCRDRGVRRGRMEDYPEYVKACDIISFDVYPGLEETPDLAGKFHLVPEGVDRLRRWSGDARLVWNVVEAAHTVGQQVRRATPEQVRAEVWGSIIHGSRGIVYIVHQWTPKFVEAGLLTEAPEDKAMLEMVTALNCQIRELAPVLNSPTAAGATVQSSNKEVPIDILAKRYRGLTYIFAAALRAGETTATFQIAGEAGRSGVQVLGEDRAIPMGGGRFTDAFKPYEVHLYRTTGRTR